LNRQQSGRRFANQQVHIIAAGAAKRDLRRSTEEDMKALAIAIVTIWTTTVVHAEPFAYQCAPVPMTNAEWAVSYTYTDTAGEIGGSNTLIIGRVDMATGSVVSGHMESRILPSFTNTALFFATYQPDTGLELKWILSDRSKSATNTVTIPAGVNTNGVAGPISFTAKWKRIVEPSAPPLRETRGGSREGEP
jgi:hypothetical protein